MRWADFVKNIFYIRLEPSPSQFGGLSRNVFSKGGAQITVNKYIISKFLVVHTSRAKRLVLRSARTKIYCGLSRQLNVNGARTDCPQW